MSKSKVLPNPFLSESDSSDDEDRKTGFSCDACGKDISSHEMCWVIDVDAPIDCDGPGFCLCINCHTNALCHVDATLHRGSEDNFCSWAQAISGCHGHDPEEPGDDQKSICTCQCSVCNQSCFDGWKKSDWYLGETTAFDQVRFLFMLCPDCVPPIFRETSSKIGDLKLGGEFSRKWFDPNLKKVRLKDFYSC